jgi:GPH family glycoside/pentoside/hexuronide:cation symporter
MQPSRTKHPITLATKLLYGFGSVAYGVKDQGFNFLLLLYYNQVLHVPAKQVGFAILIVLLIDACIDPLIGHWSDILRSAWGRRHPFMYATAIPVSISYALLWSPPSGLSSTALFYYLIGVATVVRFLISLYEIPSSALAPELTDQYHDRTSLLGFRFRFGWLGGLVMTYLAFFVLLTPDATHPLGLLNPAGYARYGWVAAALMFVAIMVSAVGTHHHIPDLKAAPPKRAFDLARTRRDIVQTLSNRSLLVLLGGGIFAGMANGLGQALTNDILTFFWGLSAVQIGLVFTSALLSAVIALPIAALVSHRIGKKRAAMVLWVGALVVGPLPLLLRFAGWFPANGTPLLLPLLWAFYVVSIAFTIGTATLLASMVADVVEDGQLTSGRRSEGLYFSVNSFIQKFNSGIGIFSAGFVLSWVGFPDNPQANPVSHGVMDNLVLIFIPVSTILFLAAIAFVGAYRIDRETHEANLERLAAAGAVPVMRAAE